MRSTRKSLKSWFQKSSDFRASSTVQSKFTFRRSEFPESMAHAALYIFIVSRVENSQDVRNVGSEISMHRSTISRRFEFCSERERERDHWLEGGLSQRSLLSVIFCNETGAGMRLISREGKYREYFRTFHLALWVFALDYSSWRARNESYYDSRGRPFSNGSYLCGRLSTGNCNQVFVLSRDSLWMKENERDLIAERGLKATIRAGKN